MPRCHQCSNNTGVGARDGDCKVCYSKGVPFCQRCAMWELGPVDADVDLPAALKLAARELDSERQDRDKSVDDLNKLGDEPLACDTFLPTLGAACAFFNDQLTNARATLYGEPFRDYCCKVLDRFQELYPTCKYDRLAIQVLIAMHLSSQERVQCRDIQDGEGKSTSAEARVVKRWHTRQVAEKHLSAHFDDIQAEFGKTIRDLVERRAWRVALASDALELWLKGFKHPTLAAIDLLAAAGSADVAREALEVWLIVYHSLTAARTKSEVGAHWSAKIGDADFQPKEALGFVSKEHFVYLYGDTEDAADFTEEAQARIEQLWNVLGDASPANALPAHPRYADVTVSANGLLDDAEKAYLQYLPTFDRPHAQRDQRTPCEAAVHARVRATLKNYLTSYAPAEWRAAPTLEPIAWVGVAETKGRTKTLVVTAPARLGHASLSLTFGPSGTHARSTLTNTEKAKIAPWIRGLLDGDALRADELKLTLQIAGETGNMRRTARRTAVETELRAVFDQEKVPVSFKPAFVDDAGAL
ncbi:MAG: hypothetical protein R3B70_14625 [Polyangiaceae bacterium]